ncbi:MAG: hypothetical protein O7C65_06070, partial [Planctomycetota bacterium]|nr:hypothetical protein [Planctomycetota bacterium]
HAGKMLQRRKRSFAANGKFDDTARNPERKFDLLRRQDDSRICALKLRNRWPDCDRLYRSNGRHFGRIRLFFSLIAPRKQRTKRHHQENKNRTA